MKQIWRFEKFGPARCLTNIILNAGITECDIQMVVIKEKAKSWLYAYNEKQKDSPEYFIHDTYKISLARSVSRLQKVDKSKVLFEHTDISVLHRYRGEKSEMSQGYKDFFGTKNVQVRSKSWKQRYLTSGVFRGYKLSGWKYLVAIKRNKEISSQKFSVDTGYLDCLGRKASWTLQAIWETPLVVFS